MEQPVLLTSLFGGHYLNRLLKVFLPVAALTCAGAYYFHVYAREQRAILHRAQESIQVALGREAFENTLSDIKRDIKFLGEHYALHRDPDTGASENLTYFQEDMLNLAIASGLYEQIAWLDQSGRERFKVNFNDGNPGLSPTAELQDDSNRYYFLAARSLQPGQFYMSLMDLNAERDNVKSPQKAILRLAAPLFDQSNSVRGIIILNVFGCEILARFDKATAKINNHIQLLDAQGFRMNSPLPDGERCVAFPPSTPSFNEHRPLIWQEINASDTGQFEDAEGLWTFSTFRTESNQSGLVGATQASGSWKIVSHLPARLLYGHQATLQAIGWTLPAVLLLELIGCWILVKLSESRQRLQHQLQKNNLHLEKLVHELTAKLEATIAVHEHAEQKLQLLEAALKAAANAIIITDTQAVIQWANPAFSGLTGYALEDALFKSPKALMRLGLQSDAFYRAMSESIKNKQVWRGEIINTHKDGVHYNEALTITPVSNADNNVTHFIAVKENITERKQAEVRLLNLSRVHSMLTNINQAIVHLRDRDQLLQEVCRITVECGGFNMAWIGLPESETGHPYPHACSGIDQETLQQLHTLPTSEEQCICPPISAYWEQRNVGSNDIEHDPRVIPWRHKALALGYRSMLALPLKFNGLVRGVYVLYAGQANVFTNQEIKLLDDLANDIAFALQIFESDAERRRAEERWHHAAAVFESTREGVMLTDTALRITMVNRAFTEITGYSETDVLDQTPTVLSSRRHDAAFYSALWSSVKSSGHWQGEVWNQRKNGEIYPELLSISAVVDDSGNLSGYVGVFADISEWKASEARMEFLANYDPLTQLPNRLLLLSRLEHSIEQAKREDRQLALLLVDLDHFKDINDSFGHPTGDELLQQAAWRLSGQLRGMDSVTRLGGDEFTVLLEDINQPEDAAGMAKNLISVLSKPWQLSNELQVHISASIGISLYPQHGHSAGELLQQADAALYKAKASGRACFRYFSEQLTLAARERLELEAKLRRAIDRNEFCLFFQPQIDIKTDTIIGAEALIRWQDPQNGLISPSCFIPLAEATGLIDTIGEWVLTECCKQGIRWIAAGLPAITLAVNVSPHQFRQNGLVATVSQTLLNTGFPASQLELELTESALMERENESVDTLNQLRKLGLRLALDDFGTGYSSLAYLKRFPLDILKIDKSFVEDIPHNQDDTEIAATIVAMAHTLRFKVLAEGVETAAQLAFLKDHGCDAYQGYLKSPPLPADEFAALLLASSDK